MSKALISAPEAGMELQGSIRHINQQKIDEFGAVSGGVGAIHLSPEFGRETPFKSTLVQGYLLLGYLTEMLKNNFGAKWIRSGEMEVKLVGPAREGDTLVIGGCITEIKETCRCEIWIKNHKQELIAVGTAQV